MSNIKLYTEEQVRRLHRIAYLGGYGKYFVDIEEDIKQLTPVELPSDEEIEEKSMEFYDNNGSDFYFTYGAKWMKSKILGNNHLGGITY